MNSQCNSVLSIIIKQCFTKKPLSSNNKIEQKDRFMLILNAEEISKAITYSELISSIEEAFLIQEKKQFIMPQRMHIEQGQNVLLLMPAFIDDFFATKIVSVFPENRKQNRASIQGKLILNDAKTGAVLAMMDAPKLTALRTAAVGSVAIKHLHNKPLNTLGVIGAGVQAFYQIILAHHINKFRKVYIFDPFLNQEQQVSFAEKLALEIDHCECIFVKRAEEVLVAAEVIITATTSKNPVLPDNPELLIGKTYIAIGSFKPAMRELPKSLFTLTNSISIDTDAALNESGDLVFPIQQNWINKEQVERLGEVLNHQSSTKIGDTVIFKSVGMALFDLVVAKQIYKQAVKLNIGTKIQD